ncbi:MAG TPA: tetratricopeptide repeat protein [Planctomycetota bacterium]|nr:tetratricopeptide repeat protein [Planctomycetota bacterium]
MSRTAPSLTALALALLLGLGACSSSGDRPDPERQLQLHREFALRYFDQGELNRAEQQADKGLEVDSDDRQLLLMKAWIRQRRGTTQDIFVAEAIFRDLINGKDYRVELGLAQALERKGVLFREASEAVASGERFTENLDPQERAAQLLEQARTAWNESSQRYQKVLELKPGAFQAFNGLQRVLALEGDDEGSLRWADRLLEDSAAEMVFWRERLRRPDLTASEENRLRKLLQGSIKLQVETHLSAATLLVKNARREEALEHLDTAALLDPRTAEIHSRRAQLLHQLGRNDEAADAIQSYLRAADLPFEHPDVKRAYALLEACEAQGSR